MQANSKDWRSRASGALRSFQEASASLSKLQSAVIAGLVLLLVFGSLIAYSRSRPKTVRVIEKESSQGATARRRELTVHVAGAVISPGLYEVPEGSRVADALSKAGGASPDAVLDNLNLAAKLKDGEKILVPRRVEPAAGQGPATEAGSSTQAININTADAVELDKLPGVGPSLARRIIEYRDKNGQFSSVEELDNVTGIGPSKLESLKDLVTI
jgi:competence protein ComEA